MPDVRGRIDKLLLFVVILIAFLGIVFLYSATWDKSNVTGELNPLVVKQCIWALIGMVILTVIANTDYLKILDFAYIAYLLNIVTLVFLLLFGGERFGARRWISLGPFSFQPSEFVKVTVILALAAFIGERREKIGTFGNFIGAVFIVMPAILLIFMQPDLGTSLVLIPILFSILFVCGENIKYIVWSIMGGLATLPVFWLFLLKDYQKNRLMVFINPNLDPLGAGYTIIQSKIAAGSGGLFGKGWLCGTQSYLKFLPERQTDFIFSVIGEEWGFVGAAAVLLLFAILIARGIRIIATSDSIYGKAIATGVVTLISFQVIVNISMTIGLMPVVGLPLPAITSGGSNTITYLICSGLLLSISRRVNL